MAIRVTMPSSGIFSAIDLFNIIDFIAVEGQVTNLTALSFSGTGVYNGQAASYVATGAGFSLGNIAGETMVVSGVVDKITFTSAGQSVLFENVDIAMAGFAPIIVADMSGAQPEAIERFLLSQSWNVTLGNGDDVATANTVLGSDGVLFDPLNRDVIRGRGGNDNLFSGYGNDLLDGGKGNDILDGGLGKDRVFGGKGNDIVKGDGGADKLFGDQGLDQLFGGAGNDQLDGGLGNDLLVGGNGSDLFIFGDGYGKDRIKGFDAQNDNEDIDLSAVSAITSFADLAANHMTQVGTRVIIDDGAGTMITLLNVDIGDLQAQDFVF